MMQMQQQPYTPQALAYPAQELNAELQAWAAMKEQASIALKSRYLPKAIATEEQAITIAMAGREIGLPPMTAFRLIHLIEGKITMAAELLLALAYRKIPGFRLEVVKTTHEGCAVRYWRPGMEQPSPNFIFTIEMAHRAGLSGKSNWKNYPEAMCRARAISAALRVGAADATLGVMSTEEAIDGEVETSTLVIDAAPAAQPVSFASAPSPVDALKAQLRTQPAPSPAPMQLAPPAPQPMAAPAAAPPVAQATTRKPRSTRKVEQPVETPFGTATQTVEVPDSASADAPPDEDTYEPGAEG